jgi:hypothetical protein
MLRGTCSQEVHGSVTKNKIRKRISSQASHFYLAHLPCVVDREREDEDIESRQGLPRYGYICDENGWMSLSVNSL